MNALNAKILITGGAGFIGSNLCEALLADGARVVCLDNFSTGHPRNILSFTTNPAFELIVGDIRNPADCRKVCDGVDYVLHHAALGSVPRSIEDPATTDAVNVGGFVNMLIAARDAGVRRFVYAASSAVYGDSAELPKVEETIGRPLSPYAVTKYVNELYAERNSSPPTTRPSPLFRSTTARSASAMSLIPRHPSKKPAAGLRSSL